MNHAQMQNAPAFPVSFKWGKGLHQYNGMTLRDYFAAKAMQGLLAGGRMGDDYVAGLAYRYADAMLKARKQ